MNLNKALIVGRLTSAPQLRTTTGGQPVATMGVATNRSWTDKSGTKQEETEFHNVVLWGRQAEIASQYLAKGSLVLVDGRLSTRSWTDKDGHRNRITEIIADKVEFGPKIEQTKDAPKDFAEEEKLPAMDETYKVELDEDAEDTGRNLEPTF